MTRRWAGAAAIAALALGAAVGTGDAISASHPVPPVQARRIASECSGRRTYLPVSLPPGFRFSSWKVHAYNVACDQGFTLRFRRGSTVLTWEAGGPRTFLRRCNRTAGVVTHLNGRTVHRRVKGGTEDVWVCVQAGYPLILLASQHLGRGGASQGELAHMAATAQAVPAGQATGQRYELLPATEARRVARAFDSPLYLPRSLPGGFIFSEWAFRPHFTDGRDSLFVIFGHDGPVIDWRVFAGKDTYGIDCPGKRTTFAPKTFVVIHGIRVFFRVGIHGGSAWRCIPATAVGNRKPLEVMLWYDIRLDSPAMRRRVSEIVADARRVGRR